MFLLLALLSCFTTPIAAEASIDMHADYYPYTITRVDSYGDGHTDEFVEIHLPCDQQFIGFAGNGNLRPITRTSEFNMTGPHTPRRYKVYDLSDDRYQRYDLMTEIVEHRCTVDEYKNRLSSN